MPLPSQQVRSYGPSGPAEIRVLKNLVKVIFADGDLYELPLEGWPKERPAGQYNVTLSKERDKVMFINAQAGMYLGRYKGMPRPQGGENPEPYIERGGPRKNKDGGSFYAQDEMRFKTQVEILDEDAHTDGLIITMSLPYLFEQAPGLPNAIIVGRKGQLARLNDGLKVLGYDPTTDEDIPYSPNVLPWLDRWLLVNRRVFQMTLNDKGFIASTSSVKETLLPAWVAKHK
jgi:hypothetical protein